MSKQDVNDWRLKMRLDSAGSSPESTGWLSLAWPIGHTNSTTTDQGHELTIFRPCGCQTNAEWARLWVEDLHAYLGGLLAQLDNKTVKAADAEEGKTNG